MAELSFLNIEGNVIKNSKKISENIQDLASKVQADGLSNQQLETIVNVIIEKSIDVAVIEKLVLTLIPKDTISSDVIKKLILWIISHNSKDEEKKISCLLYWIAGLIDFNMIDKNCVDPYYNFFFCMLEYYPKPICHLLYILTKPNDVHLARVFKCSQLIEKFGPEKHFYALMSLFKRYKPNLVKINIPRCKTDEPFAFKTKFYKDLRSALKDFANRNVIDVPSNNKIDYFEPPKDVVTWFSSIGYKNDDETGKTRLLDDGKPLEILHLLQSSKGMQTLVMGDDMLKTRFCCKLYAVLEMDFILQNTANSHREDLLLKIINLHQFCLEGLEDVSKFLTTYLKSWNGRNYKCNMYKLIEWFVFHNQTELNSNLLWPLYMLFISSNPREMYDILRCIMSLMMNLYIVLEKKKRNIRPYFKNPIYDIDNLTPILNSLSEYFKQLLTYGLVKFVGNCSLITIGITFYEKIFSLEQQHGLSNWTILPSSLVYQSLLSCNVLHIDRICSVLLKYITFMQKHENRRRTGSKFVLLNLYMNDIYNCFWTSQIIEECKRGCLFHNLSQETIDQLTQYVDLNSALDLQHHVMFSPYQGQFKTKEKLYKHLQSVVPNLIKIIDYVSNYNNLDEVN